MNALEKHLVDLEACEESLEWIAKNKGTREELWKACPRGDWLLWYCDNIDVDRRLLVKAGCLCAREVLYYAVGREAQRAIETAEAWVRGEVGEAEIKKCLLAFGATSRPSGKSANDAAYYAVAYTQPWTSCIDYVAYSAATAVATAYPYVKADAQERRRMRFMAKAADITRSVVPWSAVKTALRKRKKP